MDCLRGRVVPSMTFKARFSAGGFAGTHFFKMLGGIDLAKALGHADDIFMADQTGLFVLGNEQINFRQKVAVPLGRGRDFESGVVLRLASLSNVFHAQAMTMDTTNRLVFGIRAFVVDLLMTLMTNMIGLKHARLGGEFCECCGAIGTFVAVGRGDEAIACREQHTAATHKEKKQNPQVEGVAEEFHLRFLFQLGAQQESGNSGGQKSGLQRWEAIVKMTYR